MAKKTSLISFGNYKHFFLPSLVGGSVAWLFSESFGLGVVVFIAVWVGNWIGYKMLHK